MYREFGCTITLRGTDNHEKAIDEEIAGKNSNRIAISYRDSWAGKRYCSSSA